MPAAWDSFRAGLTAARASGHMTVELDALIYLGHLHRMQYSQYEPAAAHYDEARQLARTRGDHPAEMEALVGLGWIRLALGQDAHDEFARALDLARALGHRIAESTMVEMHGFVHRVHGRYEQATDAFEEALDIARAVGSRERELAALTSLGNVLRLMGRTGRAADCYRLVHDLAREVHSPLFRFQAHHGMGQLHLAEGRADQALADHQQALLLATEIDQPLAQASAHDGLASAHLALDQPDQARRHWEHALAILTAHGIDRLVEKDLPTPATVRAHLDRLARPRGAQD
jgi:tetratricopeptide (TPR) repeat protein